MPTKVISAVIICILVLVGLLSLNGPRVRSVNFDVNEAIMGAGQRMIVRVNQQLQPVANANVSIKPEAKFIASSSGDTVFIDFENALLDNTTYTVSLENIESKSTGKKSRDTFEFSTPEYSYIYLRRATQSNGLQTLDAVLQQSVDKPEIVIYEDSKLDELLVMRDSFAVTKITDRNTHELLIGRKGETPVLIDEAEKISQLQTWNGASRRFGYLATKIVDGVKRTDIYQYDDVAGVSFLINPFGDEDRGIWKWSVSADGEVIAVIDSKGGTYAFPSGDITQLQYYGKYDRISGFSYDSQILFVSSGDTTTQINISSGEQDVTRMDEAIDLLDGVTQYTPLNNTEGVTALTRLYDQGLDEYLALVRTKSGDSTSQIARYNALIRSVEDVRSTPNDEYVIMGISYVDSAKYDDYLTLRSPSNKLTYLVRSDGTVLITIQGFQVFATSYW